MSKLMNLLKRNPKTSAAAFVFLIALIAVIVWLVTRGGQAGPGAAAGMVPELTVSGTKTVKSVNTSEYTPRRYEYALGEFRGDNIDYDIIINTKGGFQENKISKLVIKRKKVTGVASDGTVTTGVTLDTKTINDIKNYTEYEESFLGSGLTEHAVAATGGDNYFEVIGYVATATGPSAAGPSADEKMYGTSPLAFTTIAIPEADLNYTLPETVSTTFDWTINSGGTSFDVNQSTLERTKYRIAFTDKPVSLIPVSGGGYKFKIDADTFFTVGTESEFKLDKFGDKYRLYNGNKIVTKTGGTGDLILKAPNNMTADEAEAAMTEITVVPAPKARYIRFAKLVDKTDPAHRSITVGEVYVYDTDGVNLTTGQPLTVTFSETSSGHQKNYPVSALFDNVNNLFHTGGIAPEIQQQWFEIDLGSEKEIGTITVVNRDADANSPTNWNRLMDIQVILKDKDDQPVHTSPVITETDAKAGPYHTYRTNAGSWTHAAARPTLTVPTEPAIAVGDPVKCTSNSPDETKIGLNTTRSIVFEGNVLRPITTEDIGYSWHTDWFEGAKGIDCSGYSKGDNLTMKP